MSWVLWCTAYGFGFNATTYGENLLWKMGDFFLWQIQIWCYNLGLQSNFNIQCLQQKCIYSELFHDNFNTQIEDVSYDVMTWKRFPPYCPFIRGINQSLVDSPHKGPTAPALMGFLLCQPKQTVEQTVELSAIWDGITLLWLHCNATPMSHITCGWCSTRQFHRDSRCPHLSSTLMI